MSGWVVVLCGVCVWRCGTVVGSGGSGGCSGCGGGEWVGMGVGAGVG